MLKQITHLKVGNYNNIINKILKKWAKENMKKYKTKIRKKFIETLDQEI